MQSHKAAVYHPHYSTLLEWSNVTIHAELHNRYHFTHHYKKSTSFWRHHFKRRPFNMWNYCGWQLL